MPLSAEELDQISAAKGAEFRTRRITVPSLEEILYEPLEVLQHGFIRVVDYMGDDGSIVQAARVSYGKGTKKLSDDKGLIRYLMRHRHSTPFEMCEIKLHVKLPIFVARQWVRHRTANINEYSARYSVLDKEFYVPDANLLQSTKAKNRTNPKQHSMFSEAVSLPEHVAHQSTENKQGRGEYLSAQEAAEIADIIKKESSRAYTIYQKLLNDDEIEGKFGIARELARIVLPANIYTQWYWKIDLHNLLHFVSLRADPHAQFEIRAYADVLCQILKRWVPITFEAFEDYRLRAVTFSAKALEVIKRRLAGEVISQAESGLSKREWAEMERALNHTL